MSEDNVASRETSKRLIKQIDEINTQLQGIDHLGRDVWLKRPIFRYPPNTEVEPGSDREWTRATAVFMGIARHNGKVQLVLRQQTTIWATSAQDQRPLGAEMILSLGSAEPRIQKIALRNVAKLLQLVPKQCQKRRAR